MMIEKIVYDYLNSKLDVPVWLEVPKGEDLPAEYVLIDKTGGGSFNHIKTATIALQAYADSMYNAALLNEEVKTAMDGSVELTEISKASLNSDYNFTDTETKKYRYQAVYDITHY